MHWEARRKIGSEHLSQQCRCGNGRHVPRFFTKHMPCPRFLAESVDDDGQSLPPSRYSIKIFLSRAYALYRLHFYFLCFFFFYLRQAHREYAVFHTRINAFGVHFNRQDNRTRKRPPVAFLVVVLFLWDILIALARAADGNHVTRNRNIDIVS